MIKLVSPRYLGNHTSESVKTRVVELLYSWTLDLKSEPKIPEAYNMLKKQGVVKVRILISNYFNLIHKATLELCFYILSYVFKLIGCLIERVVYLQIVLHYGYAILLCRFPIMFWILTKSFMFCIFVGRSCLPWRSHSS